MKKFIMKFFGFFKKTKKQDTISVTIKIDGKELARKIMERPKNYR